MAGPALECPHVVVVNAALVGGIERGTAQSGGNLIGHAGIRTAQPGPEQVGGRIMSAGGIHSQWGGRVMAGDPVEQGYREGAPQGAPRRRRSRRGNQTPMTGPTGPGDPAPSKRLGALLYLYRESPDDPLALQSEWTPTR